MQTNLILFFVLLTSFKSLNPNSYEIYILLEQNMILASQ